MSKAQLHEPMADVARRLGFPVEIDPQMTKDAWTYEGVIWVRPGRPERMEFSIAHELGENFLPAAIRCEATCNRVAAALILPPRPFLADLARCQLELPDLKQRWRRASFALLARRLVDLHPTSAVGKWCDDECHWRCECGIPEGVSDLEREAVERIHRPNVARAQVERGDMLALAWKLHPRGAHFRGISLLVQR